MEDTVSGQKGRTAEIKKNRRLGLEIIWKKYKAKNPEYLWSRQKCPTGIYELGIKHMKKKSKSLQSMLKAYLKGQRKENRIGIQCITKLFKKRIDGQT